METEKAERNNPYRAVAEIATELIEKHDGDRRLVLVELESRIDDDPWLRGWAIHEGARTALGDAMRITRLSKMSGGNLGRIRREIELTPLKHWRLEDGTLLRAATRRQLIEAAESLERVASGMLSRAVLYRRIASRLTGDDEVVGLTINDDELKAEMVVCGGIADKAVSDAYAS